MAGPFDIALEWSPETFSADIATTGFDLVADEGLTTAVILSLFTDRLANADDVIPDGTTNRRGWWADLPTDGSTAPKDLIGSRLWLLQRAKATAETARLAQDYCREALQWMLDDGVAGQIDVATSWESLGRLRISVKISQATAAGVVNQSWAFYWQNTVSPPSVWTPAPAPVISGGLLDFSQADDSGYLLLF